MATPQEKPLTLSAFIAFYHKTIEPQFVGIESFKEEMREFKRQTTDRFDKVFAEIEKFNQELTIANYQLKRINQKLESLEARMNRVEEELKNHNSEFLEIKDKIQLLYDRSQKLAVELQAGPAALHHVDKVNELKDQVHQLEKRVRFLEERLQKPSS